jgi:hypothetical protein
VFWYVCFWDDEVAFFLPSFQKRLGSVPQDGDADDLLFREKQMDVIGI